jgi:predicted Zn-dependent protease
LIAAALRAPRPNVARALLSERMRLKPDNAWTWQRYAQALQAVGDHTAARQATEQARSVLAA